MKEEFDLTKMNQFHYKNPYPSNISQILSAALPSHLGTLHSRREIRPDVPARRQTIKIVQSVKPAHHKDQDLADTNESRSYCKPELVLNI